MAETVRDHLAAHGLAGSSAGGAGPVDLPVDVVVQPPGLGRAKPLGTAAAVLASRHLIDGTFVVVNGDDAYPADAFALLAAHLRAAPADEHALVAFRVAKTLTSTSRPVSRAAIAVGAQSQLLDIREGTVVPGPDGLRFDQGTAAESLPGETPVSMNMWGFRASVWPEFASAVDDFVASGRAGEVLLPDVVTSLVRAGAVVRVLVSESVCVGVTHPEDVGAVRDALA
jgi:hypothetical protein